LDRLYGGGDGLGIRLGPAKVAGQSLEEIFYILGSNNLVFVIVITLVRFAGAGFLRTFNVRPPFILTRNGPIFRLATGRIRILWTHGYLTAAIVGEFVR
jgi:hypothetical protein